MGISIRKKIIFISGLILIFFLTNNFYKLSNEYSGIQGSKLENKVSKYKQNIAFLYSKIPVLMYHSISKNSRGIFTVSQKDFENQMKYLKDNNYNVLTLNQYYKLLNGYCQVPEKSVLITFDDGYEDNYKLAYPILKKYDFSAVVFVITSKIDKNSYYMTSEQLKEMENNNIFIESHTVYHEHLIAHRYKTQLETIKESKKALEKILGKEVYCIAYPFGQYDYNTEKAAVNAGYKIAFRATDDLTGDFMNLFAVHRVCVTGYTKINEFKKILSYNRNIIY